MIGSRRRRRGGGEEEEVVVVEVVGGEEDGGGGGGEKGSRYQRAGSCKSQHQAYAGALRAPRPIVSDSN